MQKASNKYSLSVNNFFVNRAHFFMKTVLKYALDIQHYWHRVEFAPARGQIHLHILGIAKDKAYLNDFYNTKTMEYKAIVVDKYTR